MRTARIPWVLTPQAIMPYAPGVWDPDADPTELYYLPDDFSQAHDLAADHPDKVAELRSLFWQEAERYQVLPLLATLSSFFGQLPPLPETTKLEFRGDVQNVLSGMVPRVYNHSYTISADLVVPDGGAEGVIVAEADHLGGFSLFVQDGKLTHTYSMMGVFIFRQQATEPLPRARSTCAWSSPPMRPSRPRAARSRSTSTTRPSVAVAWTTRCRCGSRATRAWTSAATTAASSIAATRDKAPFPFTRDDPQGRLRCQAAPRA